MPAFAREPETEVEMEYDVDQLKIFFNYLKKN